MTLISDLYNSFKLNTKKRAFCIDGQDINYSEFLAYINGTRILLEENLSGENQPVGIVSDNCIETYAAIFAIWFTGNYFVPLNPKHPLERNKSIIKNVGIEYLISAKTNGDIQSK